MMREGRFDELPFTKPALYHCLDALPGGEPHTLRLKAL